MLDATALRTRTQSWDRFAIVLVLVYLWWIITTPQNAPKMQILVSIRFERIVALVLVISLALGKETRFPTARITWPLLFFFAFLWISYTDSPYADTGGAIYWSKEYWKVVLFYFFVAMAVRNISDLTFVVRGFVVISLLYQLHSWRDFMAGGSYVWQQGMRRICGVWADPGYGAPNSFGYLALSTVPFVVAWWHLTQSRKLRFMLLAAGTLCFLSILYSGTRGALLVLLVLLAVMVGPRAFRPKVLVTLACLGLLTFLVMPESLKERYFSSWMKSEGEMVTGVDRVSQQSAQGRIDGLVDGWHLFLKRPVLGYGPGTSAVARLEVSSKGLIKGKGVGADSLQLHNMYGQILAEGGLLTAIAFFTAVWSVFRIGLGSGWGLGKPGEDRRYRICGQLMRNNLVVVAAYGMISHSLYSHEWMTFFGLSAAYIGVMARRPTPVVARIRT